MEELPLKLNQQDFESFTSMLDEIGEEILSIWFVIEQLRSVLKPNETCKFLHGGQHEEVIMSEIIIQSFKIFRWISNI